MRLGNKFLILADARDAKYLAEFNLENRLIKQDIQKDELALDRRHDDLNLEKYELIYQKDFVRLLKVDPQDLKWSGTVPDVFPLHT